MKAKFLAADFLIKNGKAEALYAAQGMLNTRIEEKKKQFWNEIVLNIKFLNSTKMPH